MCRDLSPDFMSRYAGFLGSVAAALAVWLAPTCSAETLSVAPDTWPTVFAHQVSAAEARQLNIYVLDLCGPLGSFPYRLCSALRMPAALKTRAVALGCPPFRSIWHPALFCPGFYSDPYGDRCRDMDRWFVVSPSGTLKSLLPGFRLYVTPAVTLALFYDGGDSSRRFGPGDSLFGDLSAALLKTGNQMTRSDLLDLGKMALWLGLAFSDGYRDHGWYYDCEGRWLAAAPRKPVFPGLVLMRAYTDTATFGSRRYRLGGEPEQVVMEYSPFVWDEDGARIMTDREPHETGEQWHFRVHQLSEDDYCPEELSNRFEVDGVPRSGKIFTPWPFEWWQMDFRYRATAILRTMSGPLAKYADPWHLTNENHLSKLLPGILSRALDPEHGGRFPHTLLLSGYFWLAMSAVAAPWIIILIVARRRRRPITRTR